jgi:hypothetical protein
MAGNAAKDQAWAEAARLSRLSPAEVRMAKELAVGDIAPVRCRGHCRFADWR